MKTKTFLLLSTIVTMCLSLAGCSQKHSITLNIDGLGNDTVYITRVALNSLGENYSDEKDAIADKVAAENGKLVYDLPKDEDYLVLIETESFVNKERPYAMATSIRLLMPVGEHVVVNGAVEPGFLAYGVEGGGYNGDYAVMRADLKNDLIEQEMYRDQVGELLDQQPTEENQEKMAGLQGNLKRLHDAILARNLKYIAANPDSHLSAELLVRQPLDTLAKYHATLTDEVKDGYFSATLATAMKKYERYAEVQNNKKNVGEGAVAPEFTLTDNNGKKVSLSDVKTDIVVLDFWGSWCGPCMMGMPEMKEYYAKYKGRVEFVGVAHDKEDAWKKAVKDNGLEWIQLLNGTDADVATRYGVSAFPTKMILGKDRTILHVFVGERPEFYQALDKLMK